MTIKNWIKNNNLFAKFGDDKVFAIKDDETYVIVEPKRGSLFDEEFTLILSDDEKLLAEEWGAKRYAFEFGGLWYYVNSDLSGDMDLLKYLGEPSLEMDIDFSHLGVHGGYELLNGSRSYNDWCKKAKFLKYSSLGIAEKNTLAGTLPFQQACVKNDLKSILGETVVVRDGGSNYECKLYAKNYKGWVNLLRVNKSINVDNCDDKHVGEDELLSRSDGLICVLSNSPHPAKRIKKYENVFESDLYYQIDTVVWRGQEKEKEWLSDLKNYFNKFRGRVKPALINDSYYLDKADSHIKKKLNDIAGSMFENESRNQHFKTLDESFMLLSELFKDGDERVFDFFEECIDNANEISKKCNFQIDVENKWLPKFEIENIPEKYLDNKDSDDLFWQLIEEGLSRKVKPDKVDEYISRVEKEYEIIKKGNLIDYFLILWDIIRWCRENDILVGPARGSAGGSLVSYLLDITQVDPIEYGLLFERFLNAHRAVTSLPDIDVDFEASRRGEVKRYMEWKYGKDHVASIGTFGTMKLKQAMKDLGRKNLEFSDLNYMNAIIGGEDTEDGRVWSEIFRIACKSEKFKEFVLENVELINDIQLVINQQRSSSIHASAVIITPKQNGAGDRMEIYDWMPVKKVDGMLVSEWEHKIVESAGFLKEDILGIAQLDKFAMMRKLIKEIKGEVIDIYDIPFDEESVFDLFKKGLNEDIFQFGTDGLKSFSKEVAPSSIEHLTAMNALHRPSAMEVGADKDYVKIKHGEKEPVFDYMLEDIQKETGGLFIYQEQTMLAAQKLADFDLTEADGLRKALTKKGIGTSHLFKDKFIKNAIKNGCPEDEAKEIWDKLEAFTGYGFNKSHAVAYAMIGYISQWFKAKYPLEFWTTSLQYASDDDIYKRVSEIRKMRDKIDLSPPDINRSSESFRADSETNKIYWSIRSVKHLGQRSVEFIMEEREKNGMFFSFEEFLSRCDDRSINKRVIENLIMSGAFDEIENIERLTDRWKLIEFYYKTDRRRKEKNLSLFPQDKIIEDYWWAINQKAKCGFGFLNYKRIALESIISVKDYLDEEEFFEKENESKRCVIGGEIMSYVRRSSKNGPFFKIELNSNNERIVVTMWNESFKKFHKMIEENKGNHILITGVVKYDGWQGRNVLHTQNETEMVVL